MRLQFQIAATASATTENLEEMTALEKSHRWDLAKLPLGKMAVRCKLVQTIKYRANGTFHRYKAQLVAKGYSNFYGIGYSETFALVAKLNTISLSIATNYNWCLNQFMRR